MISAGSLGSSSALRNQPHTPFPAKKWCAGTGWLPGSAVLPERRIPLFTPKDINLFLSFDQEQRTLKYWFPLTLTLAANSNFSFKSISQYSLAWWRQLSWKKMIFFFCEVWTQTKTKRAAELTLWNSLRVTSYSTSLSGPILNSGLPSLPKAYLWKKKKKKKKTKNHFYYKCKHFIHTRKALGEHPPLPRGHLGRKVCVL